MWGLYKDSLASHVDVLGITQNAPRRLAQGGWPRMRPAVGVEKLLRLRRGPTAGHFIKTIETHVVHFYVVF
jgi:hypothetical protein